MNGAYVVGEATVERTTAAVTFTEEGPRTLPALQGWAHSTAEDVNPGGVAVGSSVQFAGHPGFGGAATVWCEGRAVDLNAVTPDLPAGLTLVNAGGVNPRGQVVGYATGTDGRTLGVVLTPAG